MPVIRQYLDPTEAELVAGRLRAQHIDVAVHHAGLQNISHAMVGIQLQVTEADWQAAEDLLRAMEQGDFRIDEQWDVGSADECETPKI
jgi:hypothetical protein